MKGAKDEIVLSTAWEEKRILITEDKDFGELVIRLGKQNHGIVLLRFSGIEIEKKNSLLLGIIHSEGELLKHSFTIITGEKIRIRKI